MKYCNVSFFAYSLLTSFKFLKFDSDSVLLVCTVWLNSDIASEVFLDNVLTLAFVAYEDSVSFFAKEDISDFVAYLAASA
jgi:hypothetical protein